jgi:hypothetical protein
MNDPTEIAAVTGANGDWAWRPAANWRGWGYRWC